jgi:hypothetical protein
MLAGMKQAQRILRWAEGHDDEEPVEATEEGHDDEEPVEATEEGHDDEETVEATEEGHDDKPAEEPEEPRAIEQRPAQDAPAAIESASSESSAPAADFQPLLDSPPDRLLDSPGARPQAVAKPA